MNGDRGVGHTHSASFSRAEVAGDGFDLCTFRKILVVCIMDGTFKMSRDLPQHLENLRRLLLCQQIDLKVEMIATSCSPHRQTLSRFLSASPCTFRLLARSQQRLPHGFAGPTHNSSAAAPTTLSYHFQSAAFADVNGCSQLEFRCLRFEPQ